MNGRLIGRRRERDAIEAALDAGQRHLAALVVEGEAGIGKTAVWSHGLSIVGQRPSMLLHASTAPGESSLSYSFLSDLLAPLDESAFEALPTVQRVAIDVALLRSDATDSSLDARATAAALLNVLQRLALVDPLVIAIDDLQWIDPSSERALAYALRRLRDARVTLLCTRRTGRGTKRPAVLGSLPMETTTRLSLAPLSPAELRPLVHDRFGPTVSPSLLERVADASGGNPLHALEIAQLLAEADIGPDEPLPVSDDLRDIVRRRLRRLPGPTRALLLRLSLQANRSLPERDHDLLVPAERAGVVSSYDDGTVRFTHPLYSASIVRDATRAQRRRAHADLAEQASGFEERARHLALATVHPDGAVCAILDDAASEADRRGAPHVAAQLVEHALRLTPEEDAASAVDRSLRAGRHRLKAGDRHAARCHAQVVLDRSATGLPRAHALQLLAEASLMDDLASQWGLLSEALACAAGDPKLAAELHMQLGMLALGQLRHDDATRHGASAIAVAERCGDDAVLAEALGLRESVAVLAGGQIDDGSLRRALALEDLERDGPYQLRASLTVGTVHCWLGRLDLSRDVFTRLDTYLRDAGRDSDRTWVLAQLALNEWLAGRWDRAEAAIAECLTLAELHGQPVFEAQAVAVAGFVAIGRGRRDDAAAALARVAAIGEKAKWPISQHYVGYGRGQLALLAGDPAGALAALEPLLGLAAFLGAYEWPQAIMVPDGIEALTAVGRLDEAAQHTEAVLAWGERGERRWALAVGHRCRAIVAEARGDVEAATSFARTALTHHAALPMPIERARTLVVLGRLERRGNARRAAREHLSEAVDIAREVGATAWSEVAEHELARTGVRRAPDALTENERRVAALSAQGLTNAAVAARLHVSHRTVDANLARVYRKLGIRSRAELGAAMLALGRDGPDDS